MTGVYQILFLGVCMSVRMDSYDCCECALVRKQDLGCKAQKGCSYQILQNICSQTWQIITFECVQYFKIVL